ncbi:uncharacterized protein TOT_030000562 [Theileria orientalis strain Shintoku]|uniref:Cysteine protease TacP n=1 Tax=Theileria orientalis strain Shintoku TaxID=869250 RepID=J4DPU2_THEOR|nr:uncharacterized protein TOT_030000562 [Theileria orientalis strain Shintoku]BAM41299.1 uncharacterized protein TOT_030000562 [Theileria orientalis strain Shintoku]|eukprot:XP_009691600.1 uncharacterized protein TOT_030000562 [Theileria orientalis strain Shintoku]
MVIKAMVSPNLRYTTKRVNDDFKSREDASYSRKPRSSVARRVLATVVVLSFLVGVSVLSYFVVSKYKALSEFKSSLSEHLTKNFPELEMNKRDSYFDELTHLFRANLISNDPKLELEVYMEFESFNAKYHRVYKYDKDRRERFVNFRDSYLEVKEQRGTEMYTKGINRFSDLSEDEFYHMFPSIRIPKSDRLPPSNHILNLMDNPTYIKNLQLAKGSTEEIDVSNLTAENLDWRRANCVKPVRDQGYCCSGWAITTVDCIESFYMAHYDRDYDLSVQQVLNCDDFSFGCAGGSPKSAFSYVKKHGLVHENEFPYVGANGPCFVPETTYERVHIEAFYIFRGKDIFNKSLLVSPTVVFLGVTPELVSYKSGIYTGSCAEKPNSPVLLVGEGFDEDLGVRYWIVKTSWGADWGEDGYIRLERTGVGSDKCGVLDAGLHSFAH